ncbi:site-specific DNA-methyltransferase [bacterium]|nr:site-specific DNA-methyltransferase [bacterium]
MNQQKNYPEAKQEIIEISGVKIPKFIGEFWTSRQRKASSLHEISYRACFKPQLPRFFIETLTKENDFVYDPFSGRGTTILEAGISGRKVFANDVNPLSKILCLGRFFAPKPDEVKKRLLEIPFVENAKAEIDLSMFFERKTEAEIVSLKKYFAGKENDSLDFWIKMVATNRLTGHSKGFFSAYTLPPNQTVSQNEQIRINQKFNQKPVYKDTRELIFQKSKSLLRNLTEAQKINLEKAGKELVFLTEQASETSQIPSESIQLTVTSPPFLNIVNYSKDNWLRCWFNSICAEEIAQKIIMSKTVFNWSFEMEKVFYELFRLTKVGGFVAFEVGEVRKGSIKLDEIIVPVGQKAGFVCEAIFINTQNFTKTSNIWGIGNNKLGTNTNRIVLFGKK